MEHDPPSIWRKDSFGDYESTGEEYRADYQLAQSLNLTLSFQMSVDHLAVVTESGSFLTAKEFLRRWEQDTNTPV